MTPARLRRAHGLFTWTAPLRDRHRRVSRLSAACGRCALLTGLAAASLVVARPALSWAILLLAATGVALGAIAATARAEAWRLESELLEADQAAVRALER